MPIGSGAAVLTSLPDVPYEINPAQFAADTTKDDKPLNPVPSPGPGQNAQFYLPRTGVCSAMRLNFSGTLTVTAATTGQTQPVPSARWPHGILSAFTLGSGIGSERFDCDGLDLAALKTVNRPYVNNLVDQFPGSFGGGGSALAAGTYPISITYDVPIAIEQTSLIASLFLQSNSSSVEVNVTQAPMSDLVEAGGTTSLWTLTGTWYPNVRLFQIPIGPKGQLILPNVNNIHMFATVDQPISGTGEQPAAVQRTAGILQRLFSRSSLSRTEFLSALPSTPNTQLIDRWSFNHNLSKTPYDYNPASVLAQLNNDAYGQPLPYDTLVLDTLRENPSRDAILMQGITNAQVLVYVDTAVTVVAGAKTHLAEEILI